MAQERSLTIRVQIDGRTVEQEDTIVAEVKARLAALSGEPRPILSVAQAGRETVEVSAGG